MQGKIISIVKTSGGQKKNLYQMQVRLLPSATQEKTSTCSSCSVSNYCVQPEQEILSLPIQIHENENFFVDDLIEIKAPPKFMLLISVLTFIFPLMFMFVGAWWGEQSGEKMSIALGFLFLGIGILLSFLLNKSIPSYKIVQVKKQYE